MEGPVLAIYFLIIWINIASLSSSSCARQLINAATENSFNEFGYGDDIGNAQTDVDLQAFLEAWGSATTNVRINDDAVENGVQETKNTFNVIDFGAVGNGRADDSQAFLKAWGEVCGSTQGTPTMFIPKGKTFLLKPLAFEGPCKASNVNFQLQGNVVAPYGSDAWSQQSDKWIKFSNVQGLIINGGGQIDGQGSFWWKACMNKGSNCQRRPTALHIHKCDGLELSHLTHLNSARNHISISGCNGAQISGIFVRAPEESPNTDGIDISESININIRNSYIGTGDDCIAINSGSSKINVTNVLCGPGHGISVGSLGQNGEFSSVEEVHVANCTFKGTQNGVRIKTWPGGSGFARKISFEAITLEATQNPIIIDQHYSAGLTGSLDLRKHVQVSDVTYRNIRGTSVDEKAINLDCGGGGCTNIVMDNVDITSSGSNKKTYAFCKNAHGICTLSSPNVPCLYAH